MAIGRRGILTGGAALWVGGSSIGGPAIVRAQTSSKVNVSHGFAMHGTPKYAADAGPPDYLNPNAPKGGAVKLGARGTFDSLHPFIVKSQPAAGITLNWDTLCWNSRDEASTEYGLIAETIEWPEDRSWVAFTLRPQARWHDGSPITVEDVIFTFDILKAKGSPNYAFYYHDVLKAEKVGDRKVLFTFRDNTNKELPLILGQLPVLPSKWWASRDFEKVSLEIPLGSGPYRVDTFDVGRSIAYRRVEDWWAKDLWMNRGRSNFDVVRYEYYRDVTVQFEAFKAGELDIRQENIARNWATAYDIPPVRDGRIQRAEIPHELPTGMQCFAFNTRRDYFKDRRVREAIATMFDFAWTNKNLFYGMYRRNVSFFGNSELASSGLPTPAELKYLEPLRGKIPDEVFTREFKLPESDGTGNVRDLARRALALLKEAGWEIKDGKMTETKSGKKLAFEMLLSDASFERVVLPYKQNLERIGIDMNVRTVDTAQFKRREDEFDYDMMVEGFGQSLSPGNEQRDFWGSKAADTTGSRNSIGIRNTAIDALIDTLIAAPDRESLITVTRALDRVLLWSHFVVPNWHNNKVFVAYWNRFGRPEQSARYAPFAFDTWWIDEAKDRALQRGERK
ncbi:MAG: ABC transporter substrate-binding protein [Reyranella sp.]|uniref:extracellular solute-binding protein n=1 Tax=Reyranella sp. TaxID=1929291 RepID=UPI00121C92BD|nr:extracellular solute-binding protein [Reyranella sp.]TAJ39754.1 MAG: ABC transporter substrate-binding protein [Reyranella sp.]